MDFKKELYEPLRNSVLGEEFEFVLPYEENEEPVNSKDLLKLCDLMIAEVSFPSIGLGIEIGWANAFKVPVFCIYKKGSKVSRSLKLVAKEMIEYSDSKELVEKINNLIKKL